MSGPPDRSTSGVRHAVSAMVVLAAGGALLVACTGSHAPAREAGTDGVADVAGRGTGGMQKANGQACGGGGGWVSGVWGRRLVLHTALGASGNAGNTAPAARTRPSVPNGSA